MWEWWRSEGEGRGKRGRRWVEMGGWERGGGRGRGWEAGADEGREAGEGGVDTPDHRSDLRLLGDPRKHGEGSKIDCFPNAKTWR